MQQVHRQGPGRRAERTGYCSYCSLAVRAAAAFGKVCARQRRGVRKSPSPRRSRKREGTNMLSWHFAAIAQRVHTGCRATVRGGATNLSYRTRSFSRTWSDQKVILRCDREFYGTYVVYVPAIDRGFLRPRCCKVEKHTRSPISTPTVGGVPLLAMRPHSKGDHGQRALTL